MVANMEILEKIEKYDDAERFDLVLINEDKKVKLYRSWNEENKYPYLIKKINKYKKELNMVEGGIIENPDEMRVEVLLREEEILTTTKKYKYEELTKIINHFSNKDYDTELDSIKISMNSVPLLITVEHSPENSFDIEIQDLEMDIITKISLILDTGILAKYLKSVVDMYLIIKESRDIAEKQGNEGF
jgi:hypothetical protein